MWSSFSWTKNQGRVVISETWGRGVEAELRVFWLSLLSQTLHKMISCSLWILNLVQSMLSSESYRSIVFILSGPRHCTSPTTTGPSSSSSKPWRKSRKNVFQWFLSSRLTWTRYELFVGSLGTGKEVRLADKLFVTQHLFSSLESQLQEKRCAWVFFSLA